MDNLLHHWSAEPLGELRDIEQPGEPHDKPRGLWLSVGDGDDSWRAWCHGEQWNLESFKHHATFVLAPAARILRASNAQEIDAITTAYGTTPKWAKGPYLRSVRWAKIAGQYDGVLIAPYCWEKRHCDFSRWYYTWDCASACIWRPADCLLPINERIAA